MSLKQYELNLIPWKITIKTPKYEEIEGEKRLVVENGQPQFDEIEQDYPMKDNLSEMLRSPGMFKNAADTAEAIFLGQNLRKLDEGAESITVDSRQVELLEKCLNKHLEAAANGQGGLGGPNHEELILRLYKLFKSVKEKK